MATLEFEYPSNVKEKMHLLLSAYSWKFPNSETRKATSTSTNPSKGERNISIERGKKLFSIRLYIQSGFGDTGKATWAMKNVAFVGDVKNYNFGSIAKGAVHALVQEGVKRLADMLPETLRNTAEGALGTRLAPNQTKLFQSSDERSITLELNMTPNDQNEADNVTNIVQAFRFAFAPTLGKVELLGSSKIGLKFNTYKYPPTFDIKIINPARGSAKSGTFVNYPLMALESFGVKYGGGNVFEHFEDGGPIQTDLSLGFTALFPAFNETGTWSGNKNLFIPVRKSGEPSNQGFKD